MEKLQEKYFLSNFPQKNIREVKWLNDYVILYESIERFCES